ncbi:hypothetical protein [Lactobacillus ultunensis]|nr:hypothetical protein [Lactobacillus ultunensis]QQP28369.1 hypothetical protein H4B44_09805 [Lactobacillus ultunensis]
MLEKAKRHFVGAVIFSVIALIVAIFSIAGNWAVWKLCAVAAILSIWVGYTGIRYFRMKKDVNLKTKV